jgi:hypothetical protein
MKGYTLQTVRLNRDADGKCVGVRLGRYCIAKDIPVTDVMAFFNVSKQTVYNWFVGIHPPNKTHAKTIRDFLDRVL